jgi:hypothetical protein
MNIHKHNPPFRNSTLSDFFDFKCENQHKTIFLQNWIGDNFPDLNCKLMYMIPMYKFDNKNVFYLNYFKLDGGLQLEMCFSKGSLMTDRFNLFSTKNKTFRSIAITDIGDKSMDKIANYINQALTFCR